MHNKRIAQKIIGLALGLAVGVSTLPVCAGGVTFAAPAESRVQENSFQQGIGEDEPSNFDGGESDPSSPGVEEGNMSNADVAESSPLEPSVAEERADTLTRAVTPQSGQTLTLDEGKYYIIYDAYDENGNPLDSTSGNARLMFDNGGNNEGWLKYDSGYAGSQSSKYLWKFAEAGDGTYYMRSQSATTAFGVLTQGARANGGMYVISDKNVSHKGSPMKLVVMAQENGKTYVAIQSTAYEDPTYGQMNAEKYMTTGQNSFVTWTDTVSNTDRNDGWWVIEEVMESDGVMAGGAADRTLLWRTRPLDVHYRIPAIVTTNRGELLAVADHRYDALVDIGTNWPGWNGENYSGFGSIGHRIDQVTRLSTDNGASWSGESNLTSQYSHRGDASSKKLANGYGDPAMVADRESDKVLILTVGGSYGFMQDNSGSVSMLSEDGGKTFGAPIALGGRTTGTGATDVMNYTSGLYALKDKTVYDWKSMFFTSGRVMQSRYIKVGDFYRIYAAPLVRTPKGNNNWVLYSDDFGKTWDLLPGVAIANGDEAKVDELPNGSVVITSRVAGGRMVNVFTYDASDPTYATGKWGRQEKLGIGHSTNATNGELYILYAKNNESGEYGYLALQTFPSAENGTRSEVRIFYKWLDPKTSTPAEFAGGWSKANSYVLQQYWSAYSVMTLQGDGKIGALWEESDRQYDIVYQAIALNDLTGSKYSIGFPRGIGSKDTPYVATTEAEARAILDTYAKEKVNWSFEGKALAYVTPQVGALSENIQVQAGQKLGVAKPAVTNRLDTTEEGWEIKLPGGEWNRFDIDGAVDESHGGAKLRYVVKNAYTAGYSTETTINVAENDH